METISTWHIFIKGQVQGVGFRPFVYQLANKYNLKGHVNNGDDGLHIVINATENACQLFYDEVLLTKPQLAHVSSCMVEKKSFEHHERFDIVSSSQSENPDLLISPDFALCALCAAEINDKDNPRHNYAFTTCTQCGPRFSIITALPYDRANTTMDAFAMCASCTHEYYDPSNRRYHSQTNSCPDCAILITLYDNNQKIIVHEQQNIIPTICKSWSEGKIIAIKSIGGYLLTCDASNSHVIKELRRRKHRTAKPFALMFPDISFIEQVAHADAAELKELTSAASPVVLLRLKNKIESALAFDDIAPKLSRLGAMLPYTPFFKLLLQQYAKPIVATSGNQSSAPIVYRDNIALQELSGLADYIAINNRDIVTPQDDSVVSFSSFSKQRLLIRRSKGFAPLSINKSTIPETCMLATGALVKSSFSLLHQTSIHVSQFLGNTNDYNAQKSFEKTVKHFLKMFHCQPEVILIDLHPGYFTSQAGASMALQFKARLVKVQHHEAHFASVIGEHNLCDEQHPVMGIIWDGTGYGDDGQIWGGEFFIYHQHHFKRVNHFSYFNHFLGDKMSVEPRLSAFSLCHEVEEAQSILRQKFSTLEWTNYQKLINKNVIKTSSVGRMFDAVASLLGLLDTSTFEGEAAMLLEEEAYSFFVDKLEVPETWLDKINDDLLSSQSLLYEIVKKINAGKGNSEIAAWFHVQLVLIVKKQASLHNCQNICFSGGVFQNGLLVDLLKHIMPRACQLYFNNELSPNDENISFGQVHWFAINNPFKA